MQREEMEVNRLEKKIRVKMDQAQEKAMTNLARYKFHNFGYWSAEWVKLNSLLPKKEANPFRDLVLKAREMRA